MSGEFRRRWAMRTVASDDRQRGGRSAPAGADDAGILARIVLGALLVQLGDPDAEALATAESIRARARHAELASLRALRATESNLSALTRKPHPNGCLDGAYW
ncbi:MAG: hypothetical protein FJ090_11550 [Deltaproteobacteria bacterium]|nr:hypothetical protein [Deltaproteobacteria bacterium]